MSQNQPSNLDLIFGRRSIRLYSPGDIAEPVVIQLLQAAMAAPSAMTKDPWRFLIIKNKETLARLANTLPGGKMLATAAAAIVVSGAQEAALEQHLSYLLQDCSAAIENLLLAAHALGVGACWVGIHPNADAARQVLQLLRLPATFVPIAAVSLGLPGEQPQARTRYEPGYVRQEHWL